MQSDDINMLLNIGDCDSKTSFLYEEAYPKYVVILAGARGYQDNIDCCHSFPKLGSKTLLLNTSYDSDNEVETMGLEQTQKPS